MVKGVNLMLLRKIANFLYDNIVYKFEANY